MTQPAQNSQTPENNQQELFDFTMRLRVEERLNARDTKEALLARGLDSRAAERLILQVDNAREKQAKQNELEADERPISGLGDILGSPDRSLVFGILLVLVGVFAIILIPSRPLAAFAFIVSGLVAIIRIAFISNKS